MTTYLACYRFNTSDEAKAHPYLSQFWHAGDAENPGDWNRGATVPAARIVVDGPPDAEGVPQRVPLPYYFHWATVPEDYESVISTVDEAGVRTYDPACFAVCDIQAGARGEPKSDWIKYIAAGFDREDMLTVYHPDPMAW